MSSKIKSLFINTIPVIIISSFIVSAFIYAWQEPTENPPEGNAPAPLNVSNIYQEKLGPLVLNRGGANYGLIVEKGRVGFGTTNPDRDFTIRSTISSAYMNIKDYSGREVLLGVDSNGAILSAMSNHALIFRTINIERMRINSSGNVGIGTVNPTAKLEVAGQIKITGGHPGEGKVLTSDNTGLASWKDIQVDDSALWNKMEFCTVTYSLPANKNTRDNGEINLYCPDEYIRTGCSGGDIRPGVGGADDNEAFIVRPKDNNGCNIYWEEKRADVEITAYCLGIVPTCSQESIRIEGNLPLSIGGDGGSLVIVKQN